MKNNTLKWIGGALALAVLITGAYVLYNRLSKEYAPQSLAESIEQESAAEKNNKNENNPSENEEAKSYAAPDFSVLDNNGRIVKLSDMRGKPVVVNFWASWCPPCKAEMPDFEEMYKKYGTDITFMIVNMTDGQQETLKKAKAHITENGYTFPVYFDTELSAAIAYDVTALPATYFVDAEGNLVTYAKGMINAQTLEKGINMIKE